MFGIKEKTYIVEFNEQINHKTTKQFYKDMEYVRKHKKIASFVVIRLNCPGGSPSLSFEIAEYIKMFKKDVTVYIYIESMATSGGYFIAAAADKIYSNPYAIVGSIGVIIQKFEVSGLADKVGVQEDNITVGGFKQPLSLFEPLDEEGEEYIKNQLMHPTYNLFVKYISDNRNIDIDIVKDQFADGRIFVASESIGDLVDETITFHQLLENLIGDDFMKHLEFVNTIKKSLREKLGFTLNINIPQIKNNNGLSLS